MATRKQKMKVGLFLFICLTGMAVAIVYLAGLYEDTGDHYTIQFNESVLGLYEGGMVEYLGVPVGRVREIHVTAENYANVTVSINPAKVTLHKGVEAQLVIYSLAAGTMAISLAGGDPNGPVLPSGARIPTKPSTITAVSGNLEGLVADLYEIVDSVKVGLAGLEEGQITEIVKGVDTAVVEAQGVLEDGRGVISDLRGTLEDLREPTKGAIEQIETLAGEVQTLAKNIDEFVLVTKGKISDLEIAETQDNLNRVLVNIGDLTDQLKEVTRGIDDTSSAVVHQVDNVEYSLRVTLDELRNVLNVIEGLVRDLRDDPASLIRGSGERKE